ncbi:MAG: hypothetical protein FI729_03005 [SAR202 cluster bacterium]|jgi:hypothetical protein|nr:hypothetical protein [SAR202 cluster bacterium]|tara:strand:- start:2696 stop:3130 length:435 start_codon:yes stop_codon:yes gene_type:complete
MTDFITTYKGFIEAYRGDSECIWVTVNLSNGTDIYFNNHKEWLDIKRKCQQEDLSVSAINLQFKSHKITVDMNDCEGSYLVRSVLGEVGSWTRNYYTVGKLKGDVVHKTRWLIPELVEEEKSEDTLDNCFEEAIIYHHAERTDE